MLFAAVGYDTQAIDAKCQALEAELRARAGLSELHLSSQSY
jgi:hypothetical protein